ncbi:hypothetical protein KAR91_43290, partial [Candidatus Pacearchaeota archaeon]|nr:hypothetical protein [Candidatus Pacearchaeota archaeon]
MNIYGITKVLDNIDIVYKKISDITSESGKYNYRLHSLRLWDLNECINNLKLKSTDTVLEFGAWNTYAAIPVSQKVKMLYAT